MSKALLFWLLLFVWAVLTVYPVLRPSSEGSKAARWIGSAPGLIVFLAVALLGWVVFGDAIR